MQASKLFHEKKTYSLFTSLKVAYFLCAVQPEKKITYIFIRIPCIDTNVLFHEKNISDLWPTKIQELDSKIDISAWRLLSHFLKLQCEFMDSDQELIV